MGCKVRFSPGKSVSFIQAFMSSTSLCTARKEISVRDSSDVWISVSHRIVKSSRAKLMRSREREKERECGTAFWANVFGYPICHYTASISPSGFGISNHHEGTTGSQTFLTKLECCTCISNTAFQACTLQNLSFVKAGEELESGLLTPCKLYSLTFFSQ